jgi:hypothetical protein
MDVGLAAGEFRGRNLIPKRERQIQFWSQFAYWLGTLDGFQGAVCRLTKLSLPGFPEGHLML